MWPCNYCNAAFQDLVPLQLTFLGALFCFHWEKSWVMKWSFWLSGRLWPLECPGSAGLPCKLRCTRKESLEAQDGLIETTSSCLMKLRMLENPLSHGISSALSF